MKRTLIILSLLQAGVSVRAQSIDTFEKCMADTAHYWAKPVNDGINFGYQLLPARDTVKCYFELPINEQDGDLFIRTQWYAGYATRWHEQITGFYFSEYSTPISRVKVTILNYKLK
jgi:hypothetical protein